MTAELRWTAPPCGTADHRQPARPAGAAPRSRHARPRARPDAGQARRGSRRTATSRTTAMTSLCARWPGSAPTTRRSPCSTRGRSSPTRVASTPSASPTRDSCARRPQLRSVRELARTLGYELRPGVAAQVDLVFTVETAPGAPEVVTVPAATPVQSVPGPGRAARRRSRPPPSWRRARRGMRCRPWTRGRRCGAPPRAGSGCAGPGRRVRPGDAILVSGESATGAGRQPRDRARRDGRAQRRLPGLDVALARPVARPGPRPHRRGVGARVPRAPAASSAGTRPTRTGWSSTASPRPARRRPAISTHRCTTGRTTRSRIRWSSTATGRRSAPGSWLVLEGEGDPQAAAVVAVAPGGDALFAISGPFTTVTVDALVPLVVVDARRRVVVHAVSEVLPTAEEPDDSPIAEPDRRRGQHGSAAARGPARWSSRARSRPPARRPPRRRSSRPRSTPGTER